MSARVLIVEDEAIVACDIECRLRKAGYEVPAIAATGDEALAAIEMTSPDLVLMDIRLPGAQDGIAIASQVRERFKLPVIYLTAHADRATIERAKATSPFSYLIKPIGNINFLPVIELALYKHRKERELQARNAWLSTVLDSVDDAIVVTDTWGTIQFVNPGAERLLGWTPLEAVGRSLVEAIRLIDSADQTITGELFGAAILDGIATELPPDLRLLPREGPAIHVEGQIAVSRVQHLPDPVGTVITLRNVTVRKDLEVEAGRQEQSMAAGQLAGAIAADYKKPLSLILGTCQNLLERPECGCEERRQLHMIEEAAQTASALTAQLVELSRNENFRSSPIRLNSLVEQLAPTLQRIAGHSIALETRMAPDTGGVSADPAQMQQVLVSLILGARQVMPQGGRLVIQTENLELPPRSSVDTRPEPFIRLALTATGSVIAGDAANPETFTPLGDGSEGIRLGLAVVRTIVASIDGLLNIERTPGGTVFEVFLPRLDQLHPARTVLLIEPRHQMRRAIRDWVLGSGYELLEAETLEEASFVASLHESPIDAVIQNSGISKSLSQTSTSLLRMYRDAKVLYTRDSHQDGWAADPTATYLEEPITRKALLGCLNALFS